MKVYHVTTAARWELIKIHGLVPGGMEIDAESDFEEREFAGDLYCADSGNCVCLTGQPDGRYGSIVLRVACKELDPSKFAYFSGDAWEPDSLRFDTFREAVQDNLDRRGYSERLDAQLGVEIRYYGTISPEHIREVDYSWGV